jgi:hypothetical protein
MSIGEVPQSIGLPRQYKVSQKELHYICGCRLRQVARYPIVNMVHSLPLQASLFKQIFATSNPKGKGKGKQKAAADNGLSNLPSEIDWETSLRDLHSFIQSHAADTGKPRYALCAGLCDLALTLFSRNRQGKVHIAVD